MGRGRVGIRAREDGKCGGGEEARGLRGDERGRSLDDDKIWRQV
jgi:hypothetical protein